MLTASKAKEIADKRNKLMPILSHIENAIDKGAYKIVFENRLDESIKEGLISLGFKVTVVQQYRPEPLGPDIPFDFDCVSWN